MAITQKQLVARWELTPGRISQLVAEGCPLSSFEDAERWRAGRHLETGRAPSNFQIEPNTSVNVSQDNSQNEQTKGATNLETFEAIVERQRVLVQLSRNQYIQSVRSGSPQQSKLYASYDKTVNTLTKLKAESDRLAVMNREYIKAVDAAEAMKELMAEVVNRLDKLALDCAEGCNPDTPAKAVKVLEAWVRKTREELSRAAG